MYNDVYNSGIKRDSTIKFRASRSVNAMDLWYKDSGIKDSIVEKARVQVAADLQVYVEKTKRGVKNLTKPTIVGMTAVLKKRAFEELPSDVREIWTQKAQQKNDDESQNPKANAFRSASIGFTFQYLYLFPYQKESTQLIQHSHQSVR